MSIGSPALWIGFNLFILAMLALDLGVFHRKAHTVSLKEAGIWTVVWISLALIFNIGVYVWQGSDVAMMFLTGYLIEKSLSVDNIFVFVLIFGAFAVPPQYQHRVLFWGIIGALVMRGILIAVGSALIMQLHWIIYVFGAFLIFTGVKMAVHKNQAIDPGRHPLVRGLRRIMPVTEGYEGEKFFVRRAGVLMATPLFLVLLMVESTDLIFAVDSIPAIFAITQDPFIVYTSNVFAILGLRSMYFLLAGVIDRFIYLKPALAIVLVFVGVKMVLVDIYKIPVEVSLAVIATILATGIGASWLRTRGTGKGQADLAAPSE